MSNEFKPGIIGFPEDGGYHIGKAVQLYLGSDPFSESASPVLVLGRGFHCNILEAFLKENGLDFDEIEGNGDEEITPKLEGKRYRVTGMGIAHVWGDDREVEIVGESMGYRIGVDADHLDKIVGLGLVPEGWELIYWKHLK